MTTPGTTMIEELEHACNSASVLAMYASRDGDENRAQIHREEATRLRRRAARLPLDCPAAHRPHSRCWDRPDRKERAMSDELIHKMAGIGIEALRHERD